MKLSAFAIVGLGAALIAQRVRAQSYGDHPQVLTVGVSQFRGVDGATATILGGDGYLSNARVGTYSYYLAPLALPEGASIQKICLFANDSDTAQFGYAQAYLVAVKLVPLDGTPATVPIPNASVISSADVGYQYQCSADFSYTLRSSVDVDGDQVVDSVVHYLELYLPYPSQNALSFGGAQITWKRQVSDPPASPTFGDVPDSHPFYQYIEALAASGITGGCGSGNYCPDSPLTRGQMAVFLAKALGLHWVE
jgi:hypothetical protein